MKKFRFPLRTVATVRSLTELRARERFSSAVQAFVEAEERLLDVRNRLKEYEDVLKSGREKRAFRAADEASFLAAFKQETVRATKLEAEAATARATMESARQAWLEARRDVRVIENLETKARRAHQLETDREVQAALDDRTSALAARNVANAS
jgi:flagellar export protein FliJ